MKNKVLIFGGTTEGRELSKILSKNNIDVTLFVATEYGKSALDENSNLKIISQRLNEDEIIDLIKNNEFDLIIDATHPYASIVTSNIKNASKKTNIQYIRLVRDEGEKDKDVIYVPTIDEIVDILSKTTGNILITLGSKDLEGFTKLKDYTSRAYVRILPMLDSLKKAVDLGFKNSNIIAMQGPFSYEMNAALIKSVNAKYLITKDSGEIGGYKEKLLAAKDTKAKVIVLSRPNDEKGLTYSEVLESFDFNKKFPLFIDMKDKNAIIIGGGNIAQRRAEVLLSFGANITVISPILTEKLNVLKQNNKISCINREYERGDIKNSYLAIAATNNREVNMKIGQEARDLGIFVSVADSKEECSFWFPGIAQNDEFTIGAISKKGNHKDVKKILELIRGILK